MSDKRRSEVNYIDDNSDLLGLSGSDEKFEQPLSNTQVKEAKHLAKRDLTWVIAGIAFSIILTIAIIKGLLVVLGFGEPGIKENMSNYITGYTYSQLAEMKFTVAERSRRKPVGDQTFWTLNGKEIGDGGNQVYLDMGKIIWGENVLTAHNGETNIDIIVNLTKSESETDKLHNDLSMLIGYTDKCFDKGIEYVEVDDNTLKQLIESSNDTVIIDRASGLIKTTQYCGNTKLITKEYGGHNLHIEYPMNIPDGYCNRDLAITVSGDWEHVVNAQIGFNINSDIGDNFVVTKIDGNKSFKISSENSSVFGNTMFVDINSNGTYIVKENNGVNYDALVNKCDIAVLEFGGMALKGSELISDDVAAETDNDTAETTVDAQEADEDAQEVDEVTAENNVDAQEKVNRLYMSNGLLRYSGGYRFESELAHESEESLADTDKLYSSEFGDDKIKSIVDALEKSVKDSSNIDVTFNKVSLGCEYFDNSHSWNVWPVYNGVDTFVFRDESKQNVYISSSFIVADLREFDSVAMANFLEAICTGARTANKDVVLIAVTDTISNIKSLADCPVNLTIIEVNSKEFSVNSELVKSAIADVSKQFAEYKSDTIELANGTVPVYKLYDGGFDFEKYTYNKKATFSSSIQADNSYGQSLFSWLVYNKEFKYSLVESPMTLKNKDNSPFVSGLSTEIAGRQLAISDMSVASVNTNGVSKLDFDPGMMFNEFSDCQLNTLSSGIINLKQMSQNGSSSFAVERLGEEINKSGCVMATIGCDLGYETVLVYRVDQDANNSNVYYLHMYVPMSPEKECIATITCKEAAYSGKFGYTFDFSCSVNDIEFNSIGVFKDIEIINSSTTFSYKVFERN